MQEPADTDAYLDSLEERLSAHEADMPPLAAWLAQFRGLCVSIDAGSMSAADAAAVACAAASRVLAAKAAAAVAEVAPHGVPALRLLQFCIALLDITLYELQYAGRAGGG